MSEVFLGNRLIPTLSFTEEQQRRLTEKLWELLAWQVKKFNGMDSTSLRVEKAQELLTSLMFTLSLAAQQAGFSAEQLLRQDFQALLQHGQALLEQKRSAGRDKWRAVCLEAPKIPNVYYVSTTKELGAFFKRYEVLFAAHEIPCSIDYPLLCPVSEQLLGICYIEEYLCHLSVEHRWMNCFAFAEVEAALRQVTADIREDYLNLCEPVLIRALGRALLGREVQSLALGTEDIPTLAQGLAGKSKEELFLLFAEAMVTIARQIGFAESDLPYFSAAVESLALRAAAADTQSAWSNLFGVGIG